MTTIAFDGVTLAADSQIGGHYLNQITYPKIIRVKDGYIGWAGNVQDVQCAVKWFKAGADPEKAPKGDWTFVFVDSARRAHEYERHPDHPDVDIHPVECNIPYALGTGAQLAIGAMKAGACAAQAVNIAIECDKHSGGEVDKIDVV